MIAVSLNDYSNFVQEWSGRDDIQEINYRGVMHALIDIGYQGYVGQEFIPTHDPEQVLADAVELCDV